MEYLLELINNKEEQDRSRWVLLLLLLLILVFSILLYKNINRRGKQGNNPVIGVLTFKNRIVERKLDSEVIWDRVESGIEVRNKDTIRSAEFSDAVLTLNDSTKIILSENSMVYLDFSDGINLDFAYGSMSLEGGGSTPVKIKSDEKIIELGKSNVKLEKQGKQEIKLEVKEGEAKVKIGNEEKKVKQNEVAKVDEKKIDIEQAVFQLDFPPDIYLISTRENTANVNFSWKTNSVVEKTNLEISYDSKFRKIFKSIPVNSNSITLDLKSGIYYWRISGEHIQKKQREVSSFRRLQVVVVKSPKILSPKDGQTFAYTTNLPIVNFSWTSVDSVKLYKLEISNTSDFSNIVKSTQTSQNFIAIDNLQPGKYYARLITEFTVPNENPEVSKAISFQITEKKALEPPLHISPTTQNQIFDKNILEKKGYTLNWKDNSEFVQYEIEIAEDESFQTQVLTEKIPNNFKKISFPAKLTTYYWRVAGISKDGRKSEFSKLGTFQVKSTETVQLLSPPDGSKWNEEEKQIGFQWKKLSITPQFKWELSNKLDFSKILQTENIVGYSHTISNLPAGTYFWRVLLLDDDGKIISTSKPFQFTILELEPPTAVFPIMGQKVDMSNLDNLPFQWKADKGYDFFVFEFYSAKNNQLIEKIETKERKYIFKELSKLDEGQFYWTLKGFLRNKKQMEILGGKIRFTIYLSENPKPPKLITPKKIYMD